MTADIILGAGAWAWKRLENGFLAFIKRRWEDAKTESEKAQYIESRWKQCDWGKAAERYRERMKANYGHIRVLGTTEPRSLDELFTDIHILEKPEAYRRFNIDELQKNQVEPYRLADQTRIPGLRIVIQGRSQRLFLLGKPGAGKTTFLKYLVHQTMIEGVDKIPIFVTIKEWVDSNLDLLIFITRQFDLCHFPDAKPFIEHILNSGQAILLFDGLDEVKQEDDQRTRTISELHNFCKKNYISQMIITCRVAATDYSFTEFTYAEVADFSERQMEIYIRKWFGQQNNKASIFLNEFFNKENKGIRELGRNPLLLSLICLAYDENLHIPKRRVELYEEALDALLRKWDAARNIERDEIYKRLSPEYKHKMFSSIALETFENGEIYFPERQLIQKISNFIQKLPFNDVENVVDGKMILQAVEAQHGILIERARGIYSFSHLTFQEYYSARYIVNNLYENTLERATQHITDYRWREVIILTASLLDEADLFLEIMRRACNKLIHNDTTLTEIQTWVEKKAAEFSDFQTNLVQCVYLWFIFDFALESTPENVLARAINSDISEHLLIVFTTTTNNISYALDRTRSRAMGLESAPELSVSVNRGIAITLDRLRQIENGFLQQHLDDRTRHDALGIFLDWCLFSGLLIANLYNLHGNEKEIQDLYPEILKFFERLQEISKEAFPPLFNALTLLSLPLVNAPLNEWEQFIQSFRNITIEHRNIGWYWQLSREQSRHMSEYFKAYELLLYCLDVSYVRDREGILAMMLKNGLDKQ